MATTNMTAFAESNNILDMVLAVDTAVESQIGFKVLGFFLIASVFMALFFRMLRDNPLPEFFTTAGGFCFVLSLLFVFMDFVPEFVPVLFVVIFIMGLVGIARKS